MSSNGRASCYRSYVGICLSTGNSRGSCYLGEGRLLSVGGLGFRTIGSLLLTEAWYLRGSSQSFSSCGSVSSSARDIGTHFIYS